MPRIYSPTRHPTVPWLWPSDLEEGASCIYERTFEQSHASVWRVTLYNKEIAEYGLMVQAKRGNGNDGGTIALAIVSLGHTEPKAERIEVALLSGPVRYDTEGQTSDDGA